MPPAEKSTSKDTCQPVPMATTPTSAVGSPDEQQPTTSPAAATAHSADPLMHLPQHPEAAVARIPGGGADENEGVGPRRHPIECKCGNGVVSYVFPGSTSANI